ncbi:MAG: hypothetical protein ACR2NP_22035 [Pirellulaceae bacterium]
MYERHENEQYFFDQPTLDHLASFVERFESPCCLCCPLLGKQLTQRGVSTAILDVDDRFADLPGFRRYDIYRPQWLGEEYDLIICDPPFFNVSLSQLFAAIRLLARHDFSQPMLVSYLQRRSSAILGTFAPFNLEASGYCPAYRTVRELEKNRIEFFGNLPAELTRSLIATDGSNQSSP